MVCLNGKVNPVVDFTLNFVAPRLLLALIIIACGGALVTGFRLHGDPTPTISSVSVTHTSAGSTLTLYGTGRLEMPTQIERTTRGWVLRLARTSISDGAIDVAMMSSKLAFKTEQRAGACLFTVVSTYDSITAKRSGTNDIVLTLITKRSSPKEPQRTVEQPAERANVDAGTKKGPWSLDVIVIDPGHGGQDAGAEGVNGAYEKHVVLAIGRKLRDILAKSMPTTKVVMTRDSDVFIELFRRTEIANQAGGKLFVSIHCNSMPTKPHPAHGCETYILRPGRSDDAARVARRENASVNFETAKKRYEGMTEDQIIVATMAQRSFVKLSESFAVKIQREATSGGTLTDRGVSQAGFYVLVGASMPNVLVETGFLSNTHDAEYLASSKGQVAIAQGLARAIQSYAREYQQSLQH